MTQPLTLLCVVMLTLGCRENAGHWELIPLPDGHHGGGHGEHHHGRTLAERVCPHKLETTDPLAGSPVPQLIQSGFGFIEGPVWLADQSVLVFSDLDFPATGADGSPSRMRRFTPPSTFDVFVESSNSNGMALDIDGQLLAGSQDIRSLSRFDPETGERTLIDLRYEDHRFNSPNDLVVRSDGTVYFTDPSYQLAPRMAEIDSTGVYRVGPDRAAVSLVTDALEEPNGIALSPDESTLYVGSAANEVYAYPVADDGTTGAGTVFAAPGGSDGMAVDCAGNLYVTADDLVHIYAPDGEKRGAVTIPPGPSNLAFGGPNRTTLFITAQDSLYSIELAVPGLPY